MNGGERIYNVRNSQAGVALPSSGTTDHNQLLHFLSTGELSIVILVIMYFSSQFCLGANRETCQISHDRAVKMLRKM